MEVRMENKNMELKNKNEELENKKEKKAKKIKDDDKKAAKEDENSEKSKFFIDVSKDNETRDLIGKLLNEANNKTYGREIILKDLMILALPKLTPKDIERIQENALTDMEKIERLLSEHNEKNKTTMSLGEFLVKKLNI
jgi:hypothetical protein